ncbi:DNA processing protein [Tenacibaculum sp. 190524A02b]|uniref:DNA-processing protein DprA n=1 Tax=Tenacibaculum vairaonense TaxID=3137860 RepID=UPI0032B13C8E
MFSSEKTDLLFNDSISPIKEMAAYESLWMNQNTSFKKLSQRFAKYPNINPSELVSEEDIQEYMTYLREFVLLKDSEIKVKAIINNSFDYPKRLRDASEPIEIFYYSGNIDFLNTRSIAIVGTRKPTDFGIRRTRKLVKKLVEDDYTIISGLAQGIDTQAHTTAIKNEGRTIAVLGTPLTKYYPKENEKLQNFISEKHLLISQVPFYRYSKQGIRGNKLFFPERNKTMSALSEATVIIEAGETSGTLIQARAALKQGRKLFILQSCFENPNITWPERFEKMGAIKVREYEDIVNNL